MPKYLKIVDGVLSSFEAPEPMPLKLMQEIVGGYVENPQRYTSPDRYGYTIDVWCNDDNAGLQPNVYSHRLAQVIHGRILIAACDEDGNTVGLSLAEMQTVLVVTRNNQSAVPDMYLHHREPTNA